MKSTWVSPMSWESDDSSLIDIELDKDDDELSEVEEMCKQSAPADLRIGE